MKAEDHVVIERLEQGHYRFTLEGETTEVHMAPSLPAQEEHRQLSWAVEHFFKEVRAGKRDRLLRGVEALDAWSTWRKRSAHEKRAEQPPRLAEATFAWLAPKATVDAQLGDLSELYVTNVEKYGEKRARWLYWLEVIRAVAPAVFRLAKKAGIFGLFVDYVRTKLGL